jgi:hypothetical protein
VIILALMLAAQAAPEIASERIAQDHFRVSIASASIATIEGAQAALLPTARRLCGKLPPSFGTFRFSQTEALAGGAKKPVSLSLEQELFCGKMKPTLGAAASVPADWQPSPADQRAVLAATYAYFAAKDRGRYASAWAMLSKSMKEMSPAPEWQQSAAGFNERAGPVRSRRVTEITWYNNPPGAPQPGLYVAADYSAEFEKLDFMCGYVMWRLQPDGSLSVTREEQNLLDKATAKNLASIDRQPLRTQMGCND